MRSRLPLHTDPTGSALLVNGFYSSGRYVLSGSWLCFGSWSDAPGAHLFSQGLRNSYTCTFCLWSRHLSFSLTNALESSSFLRITKRLISFTLNIRKLGRALFGSKPNYYVGVTNSPQKPVYSTLKTCELALFRSISRPSFFTARTESGSNLSTLQSKPLGPWSPEPFDWTRFC